MRKAQQLAVATLIALLFVAAVLLTAAIYYSTGADAPWQSALFAGGLMALGQALLAALALWGLSLARQQEELQAPIGGIGGGMIPAVGPSPMGGFRMSLDSGSAAPAPLPRAGEVEVRSLEAGFQRVVVILAALGMLVAGAVAAYFINLNYNAYAKTLNVPVPVVNPLLMMLAVGAFVIYLILWRVNKETEETRGYGEAVNGIVLFGLPAMLAIAIATAAAWAKTPWAEEIAAGIAVLLMAMQAVELLINAARSHAPIEELDQEAVDLQQLPLVPMLSSVSIRGLHLLLEQSVGVSRGLTPGNKSVFARMMPRVITAAIILAILVSCFRVVPAGQVAIRERLGYASDAEIANPLGPGLHIMLPWPVDELVDIPTERVSMIEVTSTVENAAADAQLPTSDFVFWTENHGEEDSFVTGDQPFNVLGAQVSIWWRVSNPSLFYKHLSHSDFREEKPDKVEALPIYEALLQQLATYSVTKTFAQHTLDNIMADGRQQVEDDCKALMQKKLDDLQAGIEVQDLTIGDVHPPVGVGVQPNPATGGFVYGPAAAYEDVVAGREQSQMLENLAMADKIRYMGDSDAQSARISAEAIGANSQTVQSATGQAARLRETAHAYSQNPEVARWYTIFRTMSDVLPSVTKVVLGKDVASPNLVQSTKGNNGGFVPMEGTAMPPTPAGR